MPALTLSLGLGLGTQRTGSSTPTVYTPANTTPGLPAVPSKTTS